MGAVALFRLEQLIDGYAGCALRAPVGLEILDLVGSTFLVDDAQVDVETRPQFVAQPQETFDVALDFLELGAPDLLVSLRRLRVDTELHALDARLDDRPGEIAAHQ